MITDEQKDAALAYLRNIDARPGPNAGRSIDPSKPGPDADRIALLELARSAICELYPIGMRTTNADAKLQEIDAELSRLRNAPAPSPGPQDVRVTDAMVEAAWRVIHKDKACDCRECIRAALFAALAQSDAQPGPQNVRSKANRAPEDAMTREQALEEALRTTAAALKRRANASAWHNDPLIYDTIRNVVEPALASTRHGRQ